MKSIGSTGKHWKLSEETKKRMSEARMGFHPSKESVEKMRTTKATNGQFLGINNPFYSKKHTEESLQKMSKSHKQLFIDGHKVPIGMSGKHHTDKFKQEQSIRLTGIHRSQESRENYRLSKLGHTVSEETREKIRKAREGKYSGENHPNWRGGNKDYPYEFNHTLKELIRERDGYLCQLCHCEQNEHRLDVHHINYNRYDLSLENLISLCIHCHRKTNFNRDYYTKYFSNLLMILYINIRNFPEPIDKVSILC
jgi:hypothetical protein